MSDDEERKQREPGCLCQWDEGDSPCPVHPSEDDAPDPRDARIAELETALRGLVEAAETVEAFGDEYDYETYADVEAIEKALEQARGVLG